VEKIGFIMAMVLNMVTAVLIDNMVYYLFTFLVLAHMIYVVCAVRKMLKGKYNICNHRQASTVIADKEGV